MVWNKIQGDLMARSEKQSAEKGFIVKSYIPKRSLKQGSKRPAHVMETEKAVCSLIVILIGTQRMAADGDELGAGGGQQMKKAERYVES